MGDISRTVIFSLTSKIHKYQLFLGRPVTCDFTTSVDTCKPMNREIS